MGKKKTISQAEKDYMREYRRIQSYIRAKMKKGVVIPTATLPQKPKRITEGSVRRLKKITPQAILKTATYLTESGEIKQGIYSINKAIRGKPVFEGLVKAESTESIRRKVLERNERITMRQREIIERKWAKKFENMAVETTADPSAWRTKPLAPAIADNVLSSVEHLIDTFSPTTYNQAQSEFRRKRQSTVSRVLQSAIAQEGRNAVALRLEKAAADIIGICERMLYGDSDEEEFQIDLTWFTEILKGSALSAQEAEEIMEMQEELDGENGVETLDDFYVDAGQSPYANVHDDARDFMNNKW